MYIQVTALYVHEQEQTSLKAWIVSVGDSAWPAMKDSVCQTRMAHSNYGQKEQHGPPHTGLEALHQMQDAR